MGKKRVRCLYFYVMFPRFNSRLVMSEFKVGRKRPQNKSNDNHFDIIKLLYNNSTRSSCWYRPVGAGLYRTLCRLNYGLYRASLLPMIRIVLSLFHFRTGSPVWTSCPLWTSSSSTRSTTGCNFMFSLSSDHLLSPKVHIRPLTCSQSCHSHFLLPK